MTEEENCGPEVIQRQGLGSAGLSFHSINHMVIIVMVVMVVMGSPFIKQYKALLSINIYLKVKVSNESNLEHTLVIGAFIVFIIYFREIMSGNTRIPFHSQIIKSFERNHKIINNNKQFVTKFTSLNQYTLVINHNKLWIQTN